MADINFQNQSPIFAEKQKPFSQRIKELFQRRILTPKAGYSAGSRSFGEKVKDLFASTAGNLVDWNRQGSQFEKPEPTPTPEGVVLADKTPAIKPTSTPTPTPTPTPTAMPTFAPTGVAKPGVGEAVSDPITYKGLSQRQPDATIDPIIKTVAQSTATNSSLIAAMLWQESGYKTDAVNTGDIYDKDGNLLAKDAKDRGIAQINSYWHSEVTDDQANDPQFAIDWLGKEFQKNLTLHGGDINRAIAAHNVGPSGAGIVNNDNPSGLGPKGQQYVDNVARNLTPELRKELGIKTTYDEL